MQRASTIVLRGNVFVGTVPKELANLIALTGLYIGALHLEEEIPIKLRNLQKLQQLSVSDDDFTGSIPTSTFNMSALLFLGLQLNRLSDTLPLDLVRGSLS
ncbi:hypothetical protein FXO38_24890 [Capsicum annuum]|nr:hypothetical protein FXO38_24890 [Capsicum annuum]